MIYFLALCKGIQIPESEKVLLVKSGILGFGIWNTAQGIGNPSKGLESRIQIPLKKTGIKCLESGIHGVESVLDSLTYGDICL